MDLGAWANFAVASVGMAGALGGLLLVGISLNLTFILENGHLPSRAGTALATLLAVAIVNLCVLAPGQSARTVAVEALALAVVLVALTVGTARVTLRYRRPGDPLLWVVQPLLTYLVPPAFFVAAAVGMWTAQDARLLLPATVSGIVAAVWEAWVLLVEIRR